MTLWNLKLLSIICELALSSHFLVAYCPLHCTEKGYQAAGTSTCAYWKKHLMTFSVWPPFAGFLWCLKAPNLVTLTFSAYSSFLE